MIRRSSLLLAMLALSCADTPELIVDVTTDLVAGVEYDALTLQTDGVALATRVIAREEIGTRFLELPLRARASLDEGLYPLTIALTRGGQQVLSARVRVQVAGTTGISVLLTSACLDSGCSADAPNCLNAQCVAAGCLTGIEEACGEFVGCRLDTECPTSAAECLTPVCLEGGVCAATESMCSEAEYCDRASGCRALPTSTDAGTGIDAGSHEGGIDSGVDDGGLDGGVDAEIDAGPPDACELALGVTCDVFSEAYVKASNSRVELGFGYALALSGDTLAVAAPGDASAATGVDGDDTDESALAAGAVHVFVRVGTSWSQQAYIKASNTDAEDRFGRSISLEGDTLAVGTSLESGSGGDESANDADAAGAAYVFVRSGTTWAQQAYLKASNAEAADFFGSSLSLSGETLAVGASGEDSSATGVDGNQASNAALGAGAVYIFVCAGSSWTQQAYLKASNAGDDDGFGSGVALFGDTLAVGAPGEYSAGTGALAEEDNSLRHAGAAYVFVRAGTTWSQQAYIKASNPDAGDDFGRSLALDDDTLVVGALGEDSAGGGTPADNSVAESGAAYVFVRSGTAGWSQEAYLKAAIPGVDDGFGSSVALVGDTLAVGAPFEGSAATGVNGDQSDDSRESAGAVYLFVRSGVTWTQRAYIKASNPDAWDGFGDSLALSADTLIVGAGGEASAATGINGDQSDNSVSSGAAYVRRIAP